MAKETDIRSPDQLWGRRGKQRLPRDVEARHLGNHNHNNCYRVAALQKASGVGRANVIAAKVSSFVEALAHASSQLLESWGSVEVRLARDAS